MIEIAGIAGAFITQLAVIAVGYGRLMERVDNLKIDVGRLGRTIDTVTDDTKRLVRTNGELSERITALEVAINTLVTNTKE